MLYTLAGISHLQVDTDYTKFFGKDMYITRSYPQLEQAGYGQSPVVDHAALSRGENYATGDTSRGCAISNERRRIPVIVKLLSSPICSTAPTSPSTDSAAAAASRSYRRRADRPAAAAGGASAATTICDDFVTDDKRDHAGHGDDALYELEGARVAQGTVYDGRPRARLPADVTLNVTGTTVQWANMDKEISHTQMSSMYIISAVFLVLLPIIFRSWILGVIGVLINSLPLLITFGLMGLLDIKINIATALVGGVAIGSTVDSTIFFINRVRLARDAGMTEWRRSTTRC